MKKLILLFTILTFFIGNTQQDKPSGYHKDGILFDDAQTPNVETLWYNSFTNQYGIIRYDSVAGKFRVLENGTWKDLTGSGGLSNPLTEDLDTDGYNLTSDNHLSFQIDTDSDDLTSNFLIATNGGARNLLIVDEQGYSSFGQQDNDFGWLRLYGDADDVSGGLQLYNPASYDTNLDNYIFRTLNGNLILLANGGVNGSSTPLLTFNSSTLQTGFGNYEFPRADGTAGQVLTTDGSGQVTFEDPSGGTPSGSDTQLQFNNAGAFGSSSKLTWDESNDLFSLDGKTETVFTIDGEGRPVINDYSFIASHPTLPSVPTDYHGFDITLSSSSSDGNNVGLYPFESVALYQGSGTLARLIGGYLSSSHTGSGTVGDAVGLQAWVRNLGTGTMTNVRNILVYDTRNNGGGSVINNYGIYIQEQTAGTSINYDVYGEGASYFETLEFGTLSPPNSNLQTNLNAEFVGGIEADRIVYGTNERGSIKVSDLNPITKSGFYGTGTAASNTPYSSFWSVVHTRYDNAALYSSQIAIDTQGRNRMFIRKQANGTWTSWTEMQSNIVTTFSGLPTGVTGMTATITDASSISYRATAAGGGSDTALVFYDGTNWIYH